MKSEIIVNKVEQIYPSTSFAMSTQLASSWGFELPSFLQDFLLVRLCNPRGEMMASFFSIPDIQGRRLRGFGAFPFITGDYDDKQ